MLCQSAPINPRSGDACESMASGPEWLRLTAEESCNDVEQRAGPVSQSKDPWAARSPVATSRRLRPRVPEGKAQQRPTVERALRSQRAGVVTLRLRGAETRGQLGGTQQGTPAPARNPAHPSIRRGLRRGDFGTSGSGGEQLLRAEAGSGDAAAPGSITHRPGVAARAILALIRAYQRSISPNLGNLCRYEPTCSHYVHEAVERHGAFRGCWFGVKRLFRCRPLGGRGYDPVPD